MLSLCFVLAALFAPLALAQDFVQVQATPSVTFDDASTAIAPTLIGDAPFSTPQNQLASALVCEQALSRTSKPVLLVPGTGNTGAESYGQGYSILLRNLGYSPCLVSPPDFEVGDLQLNAAYVAHAIGFINSKIGRAFPVLGWSQLVFTVFPSTRSKVSMLITLAGYFGPNPLPAVAAFITPAGAVPAAWQSGPGSDLLPVAYNKGTKANYVPTTSIYSSTDGFVIPDNANSPSDQSFITGSKTGNILIQSFCPSLTVAHEDHLYLNFVYQVVRIALSSSTGFASRAQVTAANIPCNLDAAPGLAPANVAFTKGAIGLTVARVTDPQYFVAAEPAVRPKLVNLPDNPVHE